jgi:hypothetical protein
MSHTTTVVVRRITDDFLNKGKMAEAQIAYTVGSKV